MRKGKGVLLSALLPWLAAAGSLAGDWPQWRGPAHTGLSEETQLPVRWSAEENVHWKVKLPGLSGATPIIWGDHIFVNVTDGDTIGLWCVNRRTGAVLWKKHLGDGNVKMRKHNMSSPSPVTDGESVWVMTGTGLLRRLDFQGKEIWLRDIQKDYGQFGLNWGYASSPLLHENSLYIQVLHGMKTDDPSYLLRIDKKSGKTIWRVERPTRAIRESPDAYTTPALARVDGRLELVISGGDVVTGHDLETGKELWRLEGMNPENNPFNRVVASPVPLGDFVVVPSRVKPLVAVRAGGRGDVTSTHRMWGREEGPDVPTPASDGQYVYVLRDNGVMHCFEARSGREIYGGQRVPPGTYSASPVIADGKIYVVSEDGIATVVRAGPKFEILAENNLGDYTLSSPVVSRGQIFFRTQNYLWAIGKPREATRAGLQE